MDSIKNFIFFSKFLSVFVSRMGDLSTFHPLERVRK